MKSILLLCLLVPVLLCGQARNGQDISRSGIKKYSLQSGQITYTLKGDGEGEELMMFDLNGWRSVRKQTLIFELYGINTIQTLYEITDGDFIYRLNGGDSTYQERKDFKWSQEASEQGPDEASSSILFGMGGTLVGDSVLLDRSCSVWTFENKSIQELWIWNGLVLKRKTKLGDKRIQTVATKVETGITIDPVYYQVPDFYRLKE